MKNRLTKINYLIYYLKHGLDESYYQKARDSIGKIRKCLIHDTNNEDISNVITFSSYYNNRKITFDFKLTLIAQTGVPF